MFRFTFFIKKKFFFSSSSSSSSLVRMVEYLLSFKICQSEYNFMVFDVGPIWVIEKYWAKKNCNFAVRETYSGTVLIAVRIVR